MYIYIHTYNTPNVVHVKNSDAFRYCRYWRGSRTTTREGGEAVKLLRDHKKINESPNSRNDKKVYC